MEVNIRAFCGGFISTNSIFTTFSDGAARIASENLTHHLIKRLLLLCSSLTRKDLRPEFIHLGLPGQELFKTGTYSDRFVALPAKEGKHMLSIVMDDQVSFSCRASGNHLDGIYSACIGPRRWLRVPRPLAAVLQVLSWQRLQPDTHWKGRDRHGRETLLPLQMSHNIGCSSSTSEFVEHIITL